MVFSFLSNPRLFPRYCLPSVMDTEITDLSSSLPTAIGRFEDQPQTGHGHLNP
jgi:hypothetical protein